MIINKSTIHMKIVGKAQVPILNHSIIRMKIPGSIRVNG